MSTLVSSPTVHRIVGPTILLAGGTYFDLLNPEGSEFTIEDVAHGLSHVCRFAGHCREFYSVAQHSVLASRHIAPQHAYAALMHDAAEAFIGDITRPLKELLPEYRVLEGRIEAAVFARFDVPNPLPPEVKAIDLRMLATEQRDLMRNADRWGTTSGAEPLDDPISPWSPECARQVFLGRYASLLGAP